MRKVLAGAWAVGAALALGAGAVRAEDARTRGGPTAEEVRVAAESVDTIYEHDLPRCLNGCPDYIDHCGWPTDGCGRRLGRFDLTLEGTVSWLEAPSGPLGLDSGAANQVRWDDFDYEMAIGGRAAASVRITDLDSVRARGWWLGGWDDEQEVAGVYGFTPPPAVSPASAVALSSEADLWSVSLNYVRQLACCGVYRLDGFVGPRITSFDETAVANIVSLGVVGAGPTGIVRAESESTFYGAEIGALGTAHVTDRLSIGIQGALLLGLHDKRVRVDDSGLFTPGAKTASADEDEFGWGVELDATLTWRPTPRIGLTLGYQWFYLADVTRANEAMDFAQFNTGQVQARSPSDEAMVHTVFAGVTVNF
jgi:hypothetical protein